jgi:hypothetical protein
VDSEGNVRGFTVSQSIKQIEQAVSTTEKLQADTILTLNQKKIALQNDLNSI